MAVGRVKKWPRVPPARPAACGELEGVQIMVLAQARSEKKARWGQRAARVPSHLTLCPLPHPSNATRDFKGRFQQNFPKSLTLTLLPLLLGKPGRGAPPPAPRAAAKPSQLPRAQRSVSHARSTTAPAAGSVQQRKQAAHAAPCSSAAACAARRARRLFLFGRRRLCLLCHLGGVGALHRLQGRPQDGVPPLLGNKGGRARGVRTGLELQRQRGQLQPLKRRLPAADATLPRPHSGAPVES